MINEIIPFQGYQGSTVTGRVSRRIKEWGTEDRRRTTENREDTLAERIEWSTLNDSRQLKHFSPFEYEGLLKKERKVSSKKTEKCSFVLDGTSQYWAHLRAHRTTL